MVNGKATQPAAILGWAIFLIIFGLAIPSDADSTAVDWPVLTFSQVITNTFNHPDVITHAGDNNDRLFVAAQPGRIWIIQSNNVLAQPFLDITGRVLSAGAEQGLIGLAFPPGFSTNGHFYVDYTRQPDGAVVVSRFFVTSTNANVANPNSEQIVLVIPKTYNIHNGGQLAFGPDGDLYIGVGDGGPEGDPLNHGQNTSILLGKILRIDVESGVSPYAIPPSNPFAGNTNNAPEIWAFGLRNPWRFSFDRVTGNLYIGDVGQNQYEEIDYQPASSTGGQNYGWRIMEGPSNYDVPSGYTNFSALTPPVAWYPHSLLPSDWSAAVVGGYVFRGPSEPRMNGIYFYGDFIAGWIWGLKQVGTNWENQVLLNPTPPASHFYISSFGEDDQGRLYLADYYAGKIYQVEDSHQVWTPTFSPSGGIINSNAVTVACLTTNAVIHYTTNGVDPTISDPTLISGQTITVSTGLTNKVRAFREDLSPSSVATAIYTVQVGAPVFHPAGGPVTNGTPVSISTVTPSAAIYYTTNGTTPTTNSLPYVAPIEITNDVTLRAFAVEPGYRDSTVASATYSLAQAATPAFSPPSGPITNGTEISITCTTPRSLIYYTLDGTTPTTNSSVYSGPLIVNGGATVSAIAVAPGYLNSSVEEVFYQLVSTATPVFDPAAGPITNGTTVAISCTTPNATIYYTLDGSSPTTNSAIYSQPLVINGNTTLTAMATSPGHLDSTQSVFYSLLAAAPPVFNPPTGPLTNGTSISISCATPGTIIYYTTNGNNPTATSPVYSKPVILEGNQTLEAVALDPSYAPSSTTVVHYDLWSPEATVVTTVAGTGQAGWLDGPSLEAEFNHPEGVALDTAGSIYVTDTGNNVIRRIGTNGMVTTLAGNGATGFQNGTGTNAEFNSPVGVCVGVDGDIYVADWLNRRIRRVTPAGVASTFSGDGVWGVVDGPPQSAEFGYLVELTTGPSGNLYLGDSGEIRIIGTNGDVTSLGLNAANMTSDIGVTAESATNLFAVSGWVYVEQIQPGISEEIYAGINGGYNGFADGPRLIAKFPQVIQANRFIIHDKEDNLYMSDPARVRKIRPDGWVSTMAGTGVGGLVNGRGVVAEFNGAQGLCVDTNGDIFVADSGNNCIREISPDTAGIGIPDWWQRKYFGHVGINPNGDPDHDGMSNYEEFWAGTDPLDPDSVLKIVGVSLVSGHDQISWTSVLGKSYVVQYSNDLVAWATVGSSVTGTGSVISLTDPTPLLQGQARFYRIALASF